jgi:hypothetical protein
MKDCNHKDNLVVNREIDRVRESFVKSPYEYLTGVPDT